MIMDYNKATKWICDNKATKFEWGVSDCCLFTCDFVKHMTGVDPAEKHRGQYDSETGAKRTLVKFGGIDESFDKYFSRINYNSACRGDVVMYESDIGITLGIKWNGGVLSPSKRHLELVHVLSSQVIATWQINV